MSKKNRSNIREVRCGVLSLFTSKKRSRREKESYELSPMYWKCYLDVTPMVVTLHGFRSEQSRGAKPRIILKVNGCTKELLPPILRAKGEEEMNESYVCIQTDEDRIVFLKAEGRSLRDKWYETIIAALEGKWPSSPQMSAGAQSPQPFPANRPPAADRHVDDNDDLKEGSIPQQQESFYHLAYQDIGNMRCTSSTDDETTNWSSPVYLSVPTTDPSSTTASNTAEQDASADRALDKYGYLLPSKLTKLKSKLENDTAIIDNDIAEIQGGMKILPPTKPQGAKPSVEPTDDDVPASRSLPFTRSPPFTQSPNRKQGQVDVTLPDGPPIPTSLPRRGNKMLPHPPPKVKDPKRETNVSGDMKRPEERDAHRPAKKPLKPPPPLPSGGNPKRRPMDNGSLDIAHSPTSNKPRPGGHEENSASSAEAPTPGGDDLRKFLSSRSDQMPVDSIKVIEISKGDLNATSLKLISIENSIFIGGISDRLAHSNLHVGDAIECINDRPLSSIEAAHQCVKSADDDTVAFTVAKIPHGVLTNIATTQESSLDLKQLGLSLQGNEVTMLNMDGLVANSGAPCQQQVPGITNDGLLGNWALTQINTTPIPPGLSTSEVENILAEAGNTLALVFHPIDFATALNNAT